METILRIHFVQQWFGLSDPAMEEALHDTSLYCEFARLNPGASACLMQPKKAATAGHNAPEFGKNTICSFSLGSKLSALAKAPVVQTFLRVKQAMNLTVTLIISDVPDAVWTVCDALGQQAITGYFLKQVFTLKRDV